MWALAGIAGGLEALLTMGCTSPDLGRACDPGTPCPAPFVCALASDHLERCMRTCDGTETVCADGSACLRLSIDSNVCYLGGTVALGSRCATDLDCHRTGVCVATVVGAPLRCRVGCNLDGTRGCGDTQSCVADAAGGPAAFCSP